MSAVSKPRGLHREFGCQAVSRQNGEAMIEIEKVELIGLAAPVSQAHHARIHVEEAA